MFAAGGVRAAQLIRAIWTVTGSIAAQCGRQAAGGLGLGARERAEGTQTELGLGGRRGAAAFVGAVATFILTVALPGARETLPIPTQEFIRLAAALTQVTCGEERETERLKHQPLTLMGLHF